MSDRTWTEARQERGRKRDKVEKEIGWHAVLAAADTNAWDMRRRAELCAEALQVCDPPFQRAIYFAAMGECLNAAERMEKNAARRRARAKRGRVFQ